MEIRHLQSFVTAAELRNFTRAGETLGITQAAVSQHVSALEKDIRTSLFDRSGRTVELTESGRLFYDYARRVLDLCDEAREKVTRDQTVIRGTLRLAASTVPAEWLLPDLLIRFRSTHPHVVQAVEVTDSTSAIRAVESGAAELGLVGEQPPTGRLSSRSVARDELSLVVPPNHRAADSRRMSLDELRNEPLIIRERSSGSRHCVEEAMAEAGAAMVDMNVVMEVSSNAAIRAAVEAGLGSSFLSIAAIERDVADNRLVLVAVDGVRPTRSLYVITEPERMPTRVAREFLKLLDARTGQSEEQTPRRRRKVMP